MQYYLRTNNGTKNPSYIHETINSARNEAHRLLQGKFCEKVEILAVVAEIEIQETVTVRFKEENFNLPF